MAEVFAKALEDEQRLRARLGAWELKFEKRMGRMARAEDIARLVKVQEAFNKYELLKRRVQALRENMAEPERKSSKQIPESPLKVVGKKRLSGSQHVDGSPMDPKRRILARTRVVPCSPEVIRGAGISRRVCSSPPKTFEKASNVSDEESSMRTPEKSSRECEEEVIAPSPEEMRRSSQDQLRPDSPDKVLTKHPGQILLGRGSTSSRPLFHRSAKAQGGFGLIKRGILSSSSSFVSSPLKHSRSEWQARLQQGKVDLPQIIQEETEEEVPKPTQSVGDSEFSSSSEDEENSLPQALEVPTTKKGNSKKEMARKVPLRKEVSQNFVKIDLRHKHWKARKKGGSSRSRIIRERKEFSTSVSASSSNSGFRKTKCVATGSADALDDVLESISTGNLECWGENAPLCTEHQLPCILRIVKKKNKNHGRKFYCCSYGSDEPFDFRNKFKNRRRGCDFFMWADDTKAAMKEKLEEFQTQESFTIKRLKSLREQYEKSTLPHLKRILKQRGETLKGKKADLIERLMNLAQADVEAAETRAEAMKENSQDSELDEDGLEETLQEIFGYDSFRDGQLWTIKRVLKGESTLLVQSTGSGKSLCYQLPALLLPGITLVVSPLVSLMEDQLKSLPVSIPGACLTSRQTKAEVASTIRAIQNRLIKVLFVSPERLFASSFQRLLRKPGLLPEISLICVDEAHCISSWSHNFRPSYLRLRELLATGCSNNATSGLRHDLACLKARCVLALTATATRKVAQDICTCLSIDYGTGSCVRGTFRENLELRAVEMQEEYRIKEIVKLLDEHGELGGKNSVIVYVRMQHQTELVAEQLRARNISARPYHAGMSGADRDAVQIGFMKGTFRIIVATIAFGMGIDKPNIRGVIHMGLPRSIEDYVQETGRAGRDGQDAICIAFFDECDAKNLHSLSFQDAIPGDKGVRGLLEYISKRRFQKQIGFNLEKLSKMFDMKDAVLETLLVYLSLPPFQLVQLLPSGYGSCTIQPRNVESLSNERDIVLNVVKEMAGGSITKSIEVDLVELAERVRMSFSEVIRTLSLFQDQKLLSLMFTEPSLFAIAVDPGEERWSDVKALSQALMEKSCGLESLNARKVEFTFSLFKELCNKGRKTFKKRLSKYFEKEEENEEFGKGSISFASVEEARTVLIGEMKTLLRSNEWDRRLLTGRSLARVLHGIPSPAMPRDRWKSNPLWGKRREYQFLHLVKLADEVVSAQCNYI